MKQPLGCMIRTIGLRDRIKRNTPQKWLGSIGIDTFPTANEPISSHSFGTPGWITICNVSGMEIWLGGGLFDVFNILSTMDDFKKLGTGVVFVSDEDNGYFALQEFYDGAVGWGGQLVSTPSQLWSRPDIGCTISLHLKAAYAALAHNIGAKPIVIASSVMGINGADPCGVAWHESRGWVLALIGDDSFEEVDLGTYEPIGVPYSFATNPDGWPSYWRQEHLFAAVQDHLSRAWCGIALSEFSVDHPKLVGTHQRLTIANII